MGTYVTSQGFVKKRQDEIRADLQAVFRIIYGNDVQLAEQSTNGQKIGVWSEGLVDMWDLAQTAYAAFDPAGVKGTVQDLLYKLNGLTRLLAAPSTVTLTITGTPGTLVEAGFSAANAAGLTFQTDDDVTIADPAGYVDAEATATVNGPNTAEAGTITVITIPVSGVDSVTNAAAAIPGRNDETDGEFRSRRQDSTAIASLNLLESAYTALRNCSGVQQVKVYQYDGTGENPASLPAHSWQAVVAGGDPQSIGNLIWRNSPVGIRSEGSEIVEIESDVIPDVVNTVRFERPDLTNIIVELTTETSELFPSADEELIKQNIVDYATGELVEEIGFDGFGVGVDISVGRLYTAANLVPEHAIKEFKIKREGETEWEEEILRMEFKELGVWAIENITVITVEPPEVEEE